MIILQSSLKYPINTMVIVQYKYCGITIWYQCAITTVILLFFVMGCFRLCTKKQSSAYIIMRYAVKSISFKPSQYNSPLPECLRQIFRDPLSRHSRQEFHWLVQTWGWGKVIVLCCTQTCPLETACMPLSVCVRECWRVWSQQGVA